jgi:hypothetical protein
MYIHKENQILYTYICVHIYKHVCRHMHLSLIYIYIHISLMFQFFFCENKYIYIYIYMYLDVYMYIYTYWIKAMVSPSPLFFVSIWRTFKGLKIIQVYIYISVSCSLAFDENKSTQKKQHNTFKIGFFTFFVALKGLKMNTYIYTNNTYIAIYNMYI